MEKAKIKFADGTELSVNVNGSSFIIDEKPEFPDNLEGITITQGKEKRTIEYGEILECASVDDKYWFAIIEIPEDKRKFEEMQSNLLYIAMMSDVEL